MEVVEVKVVVVFVVVVAVDGVEVVVRINNRFRIDYNGLKGGEVVYSTSAVVVYAAKE